MPCRSLPLAVHRRRQNFLPKLEIVLVLGAEPLALEHLFHQQIQQGLDKGSVVEPASAAAKHDRAVTLVEPQRPLGTVQLEEIIVLRVKPLLAQVDRRVLEQGDLLPDDPAQPSSKTLAWGEHLASFAAALAGLAEDALGLV